MGWRLYRKGTHMLAPLATLLFLGILLMLGPIAVAAIGQSGGRMAAALRGRPGRRAEAIAVSLRVRRRAVRPQAPLRARPRLRAAA